MMTSFKRLCQQNKEETVFLSQLVKSLEEFWDKIKVIFPSFICSFEIKEVLFFSFVVIVVSVIIACVADVFF